MGGFKYDWRCPNCGTTLKLKMRATQTKRKCPHCGSAITPAEIDKQATLQAIGGFIASLCLFAVIFFCCKGCPKDSSPETREPAATAVPAPPATVTPAADNSAVNAPAGTSNLTQPVTPID